MNKVIYILIFCLTLGNVYGQVYADKSTVLNDTTTYTSLLPIFGKKVKAMGFDLPYSAGLSVNYLWQKSEISISNVSVGFNNSPLYDVDELINFNSTTAESNGVNIRPDIWVFPFLNVYGIIANATSTTNVDVSIWLPRINESEEIFNIQTNPEFNTTTAGFGFTPTAGFYGGWIAFDMNFTWTDVDGQEKPVFAFVFDPRIGKTFELAKPNRNISFWVGAFRLKINRETRGNIALGEVFPIQEWDQKITNAQGKVGEAQIELDTWWEDLTPVDQRNPVNIVKREGNQKKIDLAATFLNAAENAVDTADSSSLQYSLDKKQKSMWNFVVGSQFQLNKSWMIRAEYGRASGRDQVFCGLQYRFDL